MKENLEWIEKVGNFARRNGNNKIKRTIYVRSRVWSERKKYARFGRRREGLVLIMALAPVRVGWKERGRVGADYGTGPCEGWLEGEGKGWC
jgi:hypothetical protein